MVTEIGWVIKYYLEPGTESRRGDEYSGLQKPVCEVCTELHSGVFTSCLYLCLFTSRLFRPN